MSRERILADVLPRCRPAFRSLAGQANLGDTTLAAALLHPEALVLAVEPNHVTFFYLLWNLRLNRMPVLSYGGAHAPAAQLRSTLRGPSPRMWRFQADCSLRRLRLHLAAARSSALSRSELIATASRMATA